MEYGLIILCGIIPLILRRVLWVRIVSLIVLGGLIVSYMMSLQTSARLASRLEYKETKEAPSMEWMDGARKTARVVEDYHPTGFLLFAALMVLAVAPYGKSSREKLPENKEKQQKVERVIERVL